jgi:integrase
MCTKIERRKRPDAGHSEHFILPEKGDLRALLLTARRYDNTGRASAVVRLMMFAGLRISELRGLLKSSIVVKDGVPQLLITQRADQRGKIGPVKGAASVRTVEFGPDTMQDVKTWIETAPVGQLLPRRARFGRMRISGIAFGYRS